MRRVGLVGCVKQKLACAAPARDLYVSPLFIGRRRWVERTCDEWWVLSAKHGLVHPHDTLAPYDESLTAASAAERRVWAERVAVQLAERVGPGVTFEAHAGACYLDYGLVEHLHAAGCDLQRPAAGLGIGAQLSLYAA